jgi:serine/threonine protein kinase
MHAYAADQPIRHGDITLDNILLDERLTRKISEFDLSKILQADGQFLADHVPGHRGYNDPVFLQTGLLTLKSDVYSFGVVLLELITRKQNSYTDLPCNLINEFRRVFKHDEWSLREMFDLEIATEEDIPILEIGKLAIECLTEDLDDQPDMTEVAEQLMMLRRDRKQGKAGNIQDKIVSRQGKTSIYSSSSSNCNFFSNRGATPEMASRLKIFTKG